MQQLSAVAPFLTNKDNPLGKSITRTRLKTTPDTRSCSAPHDIITHFTGWFLSTVIEFILDSKRLLQRCTKPDAREFKKIAFACGREVLVPSEFDIVGDVVFPMTRAQMGTVVISDSPLWASSGTVSYRCTPYVTATMPIATLCNNDLHLHRYIVKLVFIPINNIIVGM